MIWILLRAVGLASIYLMVMTSVAPGDLLIGGLLGLAVAVAVRPEDATERSSPSLAQVGAVVSALARTAAEMVRGSWRVVRFCLGKPAEPGFVTIPREGRSRREVAFWGVLTGEAPDEFPVDVDEENDELIVHLTEAGDPDAVRARHRRASAERMRRAAR
jgi:multisubunit Na+/H+ antiporter MnhE subunit